MYPDPAIVYSGGKSIKGLWVCFPDSRNESVRAAFICSMPSNKNVTPVLVGHVEAVLLEQPVRAVVVAAAIERMNE